MFLTHLKRLNTMRKSVFGLAIAGATLAGAMSSAGPAHAINYVYNNVTYDVTTLTGTFNDLQATLTASNNALWGNSSLSSSLVDVVKGDLGFPNDIAGDFTRFRGSYFAYDFFTPPFITSGYVGTYAYDGPGFATSFNSGLTQNLES